MTRGLVVYCLAVSRSASACLSRLLDMHSEDMSTSTRLPPELKDPIISLACFTYIDSLILNTLIVDPEEARLPEGEQVRAQQPLEQ